MLWAKAVVSDQFCQQHSQNKIESMYLLIITNIWRDLWLFLRLEKLELV